MITLKDQLNRSITLSKPATRIISVVPSITELLSDLNLDNEVIGITKFCVHPQSWFRSKSRIGGTKKLHIEKINQLKPDLIIANKEENNKEEIENLCNHFNVYISEVNSVEDCLELISDIGKLCARSHEAQSLITKIKIERNKYASENYPLKNVAYFIWKEPYMVVGQNTFINQMLNEGQWNNVFSDLDRYPEISLQDLMAKKLHYIFLSSEPYPFKEKHIKELYAHYAQNSNVKSRPSIHIVDGEMFSWYGSHILKSYSYFRTLRKKIDQ